MIFCLLLHVFAIYYMPHHVTSLVAAAAKDGAISARARASRTRSITRYAVLFLLDSFCQRIFQRVAIAVKSLQHTGMVVASRGTRSWHS